MRRVPYDEYLRSAHWQKRRLVAGKAAQWTCACGDRATEIHHRCYARLGHERANDLRAVCQHCHRQIHEQVREGATLAGATDAVLGVDRPIPNGPTKSLEKARARRISKARRTGKKKKAKAAVPVKRKVAMVAAENDKLHEIQVRNRERQVAARQERR